MLPKRALKMRPPWDARSRRAFTLIEILLGIGLIGLLSVVLVSVGGALTNKRARSPQEIFWDAARTARRTALKNESEVRLSFDSKEKAFVLDAGGLSEKFPVPDTRDLTIEFLQPQSTGGSILIGGSLVDTQTIPVVPFYPDGTCRPFRIQFRTTGPAQIFTIDPWTCAPALEEAKKT
jgi:general secretion pathway protein H